MSVVWSKDIPQEIRVKWLGDGKVAKTFFIDGEEFPFHVSLAPAYEVKPGYEGEWVTGEDGAQHREFDFPGLTITLPAYSVIDETAGSHLRGERRVCRLW